MASLTQGAQNENLVMHRGKAGDGLKPDLSKPMKTAKKPLGQAGEGSKPERKPLGDLSNIRKSGLSNRVTKDISTEPKAQENTESGQWNFNLTKEEIKQCEEWAEEGIEHMHFTGNDIQQLEKDRMEKRVKDEVAMVMSSMHEWGKDMFDLVFPVKDFEDSEFKWEFEPEILSPVPEKRRYHEDKLDELLDESDSYFSDSDLVFEFKLKDFSDSE
ncbi:hypothetical protein FCM35_KLT05917 [Carex littledalei]|uniref:Uncharacterized protein n=1 Tax=Carex littledalei TaxID=544730 RepID=A0A833QT06_9POAL|nr:hypothetical protein FCM35_KLT05917 [Carex littledalei]